MSSRLRDHRITSAVPYAQQHIGPAYLAASQKQLARRKGRAESMSGSLNLGGQHPPPGEGEGTSFVCYNDLGDEQASTAANPTRAQSNANINEQQNDVREEADQDQNQSQQVQFSDEIDLRMQAQHRLLQRPVTADQNRNRVRKAAADAIFKKWGFKNPSRVLADSDVTYQSFTTTGTLRQQHQRLMYKVDDMIKLNNERAADQEQMYQSQ